MTLDRLWYLAEEADQRAEQAYYRTEASYDGYLERTYRTEVRRRRFRRLVDRIRASGAPYGAHTLVVRPSGELLLVRHEGVEMWVLPGGGVEEGESFRETARRELDEEAGIDADYRGLAMLNRVEIESGEYDAWGVIPVFRACAESAATSIDDPDGEISAARWFEPDAMPADTRDRETIRKAVATGEE